MEACVGRTWGAIASDVKDAPGCVRGCRDSLRRLLAPSEETYEVFCRTLAQLDQPQIEDMLIGLYCCDAQLCGVDNISLPGYDPNVDLLITVCSSLGYEPIRDPGPPAVTHTCINTLLPSSDISCSRTTISPTTISTRSSSQPTPSPTSSTSIDGTASTTNPSKSSTSTPRTTSTTGSSSSSTTTSTAMTSTSGTAAAPPTISSIEDPGLAESLAGGPNDTMGGLSTAAKIIIAAAVGGAILVAIIAVLWHYRYGRKSRGPEPPEGDSQPSLVLVPPISPTSPLVTPSYLGRDGSPLTPPPRLKERRLLPSGSTEQLIERGPSRLRQGFHLPTASRAGIHSPYGSTVTPPLAMTAAAAVAAGRGPPSPNRGPYLSPTRSQFASISYASSLADPGPPPSRDLPSTPTRTATIGSRSRAEVSPNAIGVALAFPPHEDDSSAQVSSESSESRIMTGPMRGTWGDSWAASRDGAPTSRDGVPAPLTPRTPAVPRTSRSPILQEQELARMAGSY